MAGHEDPATRGCRTWWPVPGAKEARGMVLSQNRIEYGVWSSIITFVASCTPYGMLGSEKFMRRFPGPKQLNSRQSWGHEGEMRPDASLPHSLSTFCFVKEQLHKNNKKLIHDAPKRNFLLVSALLRPRLKPLSLSLSLFPNF